MPTDEQIGVVLIASGGDEAEVDAADLQQQLGALLRTLKETAKAVDSSTADQIEYKVESLSTNSPASIVLRAEALFASDPVDIPKIHDLFDEGVRFVAGERDQPPRGVTGTWMKRLAEFCVPIGQRVSQSVLNIGASQYEIGIEFKRRLSAIGAKDTVEKNSHIKGRLEAMNIHGQKRTLTIYPSVGPTRVKCVFPKALTGAAKDAMGDHVTVFGDLKYHWRDPFPYEIKVTKIVALPSEADLPLEKELWGLAPAATGDQSSEEFVNDLRDGR